MLLANYIRITGAAIQRFPGRKNGTNRQWEKKKEAGNNSGYTGEVKDAEASKQMNEKSKGEKVNSQQSNENPNHYEKEVNECQDMSKDQEDKAEEETEMTDKHEKENQQEELTPIENPETAMVVFNPRQAYEAEEKLRDENFLAGKRFEKEFHGFNQEPDDCKKNQEASPPEIQNTADDGFITVRRKGKNKEKEKQQVTRSMRVTRSLALSIRSD